MTKLPSWAIAPLLFLPYALALGAMAWTVTSDARRTREDAISHLARHTRNELRAELVIRLEALRAGQALWQNLLKSLAGLQSERRLSPDDLDYLVSVPFEDATATGLRSDLLLLVGCDGRIKNVSGGSPGLHARLRNQPYQKYVPAAGTDPTWLAPVFTGGSPIAALGWHRSELSDASGYAIALAAPIEGAIPVSASRCAGSRVGYATVLVAGWEPFLRRVFQVKEQLTALHFESGYAYLIDRDDDTTIGHPERSRIGSSLLGLIQDERTRGLQALIDHLRRHDEGPVSYRYPEATKKRAHTAPIRSAQDAEVPAEFAWTVGVGIDDGELVSWAWRSFRVAIPLGLAAGITSLGLWWWQRKHYRVTVLEIVDQLRKAGSNEGLRIVDAGEREQRELVEAVNDFLLRQTVAATFKPIDNPYVVGNPVQREQMFFGRSEELAWMMDQLGRVGNEMILLVGQRRIGKTSILYRVRDLCRSQGLGAVFINVQRLTQDLRSDADFFARVGHAICDGLPDHPGVRRFRSSGFALRQASDLSELVHQLGTGGSGLILLLDELESLSWNLQHGYLTEAPILWLAGQLEDRSHLSVVATGSSEFPNDTVAWQTLSAKVQARRISFLLEADAEGLIRAPLEPTVMYHQGIVRRIIRFCGRHPLFTQDFCHRLVGRLNRVRHYDVGIEDFDDVCDDMVRNPPNSIEGAWLSLDERHRTALSAFALALEEPWACAGTAAAYDAIPADLREQHFRQRSDLQPTVNELKHAEWLDHEDAGYRLACDLWRLWICEYHPL